MKRRREVRGGVEHQADHGHCCPSADLYITTIPPVCLFHSPFYLFNSLCSSRFHSDLSNNNLFLFICFPLSKLQITPIPLSPPETYLELPFLPNIMRDNNNNREMSCRGLISLPHRPDQSSAVLQAHLQC